MTWPFHEASYTPAPVLPPLAPSGVTFRDPITGMEFILIKGGCYQMGDVFDDGDREERPLHEVCGYDFIREGSK
jgi:hypothetical protein